MDRSLAFAFAWLCRRTASFLPHAMAVVEGGKDVGSVGVIALGFGLAGIFAYSVVSELFFKEGPGDIAAKTTKRLANEMEVGLRVHQLLPCRWLCWL